MTQDLGYDLQNDGAIEAFINKKLVTQDYLKVNLFYQTLNVKQIKQQPKYPVLPLTISNTCYKIK